MEKWYDSRMTLTIKILISVGFLAFVIAYLLNKHGYPEFPCALLCFNGCVLYIGAIGLILLHVPSDEGK